MLKSILKLCLLLVFSFVMITPLTFVEEKSDQSGLLFIKISDAKISYGTFTLVYHIELSDYFSLSKSIVEYIEAIDTSCMQQVNSTCGVVIQSMKNQLEDIQRDEKDVEAYQQKQEFPNSNSKSTLRTRRKRALEFVGNGLNWAFGLMDADDAREYSEKINKLIGENDRVKINAQDHIGFIRETIDHLNDSFVDISEQMKAINNKITLQRTDLDTKLRVMEIEAEILKMIVILRNLMAQHQRKSSMLLRSLENAVSGRINQLIPTVRLEKDLIAVQTALPLDQMLPVDFTKENPLSIFKYSKSAASLFGSRFLLQIKLPIIQRMPYEAYEIVPIPTTIGNKVVIVNSVLKFVLVSKEVAEYIPITQSELDASITSPSGEKFITPFENTHLDFSRNCEMTVFMAPHKKAIENICTLDIIPKMNYFIALNHNNTYFVVISKPVTLIENCRGKQMKSHDLHRSGKLVLDPGCSISTDKISIKARSNYRMSSEGVIVLSDRVRNLSLTAFTEKIANLKDSPIPEMENDVVIKDFSVDFLKLKAQANTLMEKAVWDSDIQEIRLAQSSSTDLTGWAIGFVAAILIILTMFLITQASLKFYKISKSTHVSKPNNTYSNSNFFPESP